jgi:hypothetical protein
MQNPNMNKIILIAVCLLNVLKFSAQKGSIGVIDESVAQIKANLETLQKEEKINSPEVFQYFYYQENEPRMIVVQENGKIEKNIAWYFKNKLLIHTETNWTDSASGKNLYREKTYHDKNGMIAWLNTEDTFVRATSDEFKKLNRETAAESRRLLEEAKKAED